MLYIDSNESEEFADKFWLHGIKVEKIDSRNTVWGEQNLNGFDDMSKPCPFSTARFVCPESYCSEQRSCVWGYEG